MVFVNDEYIEKHPWLPRRPFVSIPDMLVAGLAGYLVLVAHGLVQIYFAIAFMQFAVSAVHHWLPQQAWHYISDRCVIFWLISLTPLPYLDDIAQSWQGFQVSFWASVGISAVGCVYFVFKMLRKGNMPSTDWYMLPFGLGAFTLLAVELPSTQLYFALWSGVLLYAFNGVVVKRSWPTIRTSRVVQHWVFLYPAFGLHAYVVLHSY